MRAFNSCAILLTLFWIGRAEDVLPTESENTVDGKIVGGQRVNIGSVPWTVAILPGPTLCGGAILNENWILTAAHCTYEYTAPKIRFAVGVQHMSGANFNPVSQVVQHPSYNFTSQYNDIALLRAASPIQFSSTVAPIRLGLITPPDRATVMVAGYGTTAFRGRPSMELMGVEVQMVNYDECNRKYNNVLWTNMMCAGGLNRDSCQGDSGGPLIYDNSVVGVVSFGAECAHPDYPGVYTKVPQYIEWIMSVTGITSI